VAGLALRRRVSAAKRTGERHSAGLRGYDLIGLTQEEVWGSRVLTATWQGRSCGAGGSARSPAAEGEQSSRPGRGRGAPGSWAPRIDAGCSCGGGGGVSVARARPAARNRERGNSPAAAGVFCFDSGNTGGEARVLGWRQGGVRRQGPGWGLIKGRRPGLGVRVQEVRGEIFGGDCGEALRCGGEGAGRRARAAARRGERDAGRWDRGERAEARGAGDAGLLRVCALGRAQRDWR